MSWLNNSLSSLKGQITNFAQEVLAETGADEEPSPAEVWEETQRKNEELTSLCVAKESEIASLRKQISDLVAKNTDNGKSSKSVIDKNASLEDSWCWEPENNPSEGSSKNDHERVSESSSGGGDLIAIPLDGSSSHDTEIIEKYQRFLEERDLKLKRVTSENTALFAKVNRLTDENVELHSNLEELDNQHNAAMKEVLSLKNDWQNKWNLLNGQYKALTQECALNGSIQQDYEALQKKFESIQSAYTLYVQENEVLKLELEKSSGDVKILESENENLTEVQQKYSKVVQELEELKVQVKEISDQKAEIELEHSKKCKVEDDFIVLQEDDIPHTSNNFEQKYLELSIEKERVQTDFVTLQNKLKDVQKDHETVKLELEAKIKDLINEIENLRASEVKLSTSADNQEVENYKSQISELTETVRKCEANASDVESKLMLENVNLQKQLIDLESSINKRNTETGSQSDNILNFDDINQLISSYMKIDSSITDKSSLESAFKSIADKIWKVDILEKNLKELSDEVSHLKTDKSSIDHDRKTLQADIEHYEVECAELMKNNEILLNELENYKRNKLETIHENNEEGVVMLEKQLEESNSYLRKLEDQYNETVEKLLQADEKRYELEDHIEGLQESNASLTNEIKTLNQQLETLESDKSNLIFEINEMKTDDKKSAVEMEILEHKKINERLRVQFDQLSKEHEELVARQKIEHDPPASVEADELSRIIDTLKQEKTAIENEKKILQSETEHYELKFLHLKDDNEMLRKELIETQSNASGESSSDIVDKLKKKLLEARSNTQCVEDRFNEISQRVGELELQNNEIKSELYAQQDNNTNLMAELGTLKALVVRLEGEKGNLIFEINKMRTDDNKSEAVMQSKLLEHEANVSSLEAQLDRLSKDHADLVAAMQAQKTNFAESRKKADENISNLEKQLRAKNSDDHTSSEYRKTTEQKLQQQDQEINDLKQKLLTTEEQSNNSNEQTISELTQLRQTIDTVTQEKANLIATLTTKHNENTQYYVEIQRLGQLLQAEVEKSKTALANCENCRQLEATTGQNLAVHQSETEKLRDQINFLKEKSDILTSNLMSEQTNQKLLQQEKFEVVEQNNILRRDLDRLREHLVELEEAHTQETLDMQNSIDDTKAKMLALQDEVSNSSNAYTSASIRANQHAETLQAQYLLLTQQRDEYAAKLSGAEDKELRNQAALVNLQCALEQFQKEKEADILSATQRIRKEMQNEQDKQQQIQYEIKSLQKQLAEANQGLLAAARLSDQLEISQVTIASLKDEIAKQQSKVEVLDEKLRSTQQSQEDKVEKNLVKSLLIGYIVSANQSDKNQILKLISSVLDFTPNETDRIGLNKSQSGWLTGLLQGGNIQQAGAHNKDSLAQAFVNFLEKESLPRKNEADMPNLLNISNDSKTAQQAGNSTNPQLTRKLSEQSNSSNPSTIGVQPILLNENVLEQFAPTRNSSSILKDILSDS